MDFSRSSQFTGSFVLALVCGPLLLSGQASAQSLKLSGALAHEVRTGNATHYWFTSDGARIVYRADRAKSGVFELFSRPTDGSAPSIRLNGPLPLGGTVGGNGFGDDNAVGAGERVAFRADQTVQGIFELYSVPADGSASPLRLSPALEPVSRFWLSPDRDQVYYVDQQGLQRVPLDGSAAPGPIVAGIEPHRLLFSPDGSRLLLHSPNPQGFARELLHVVPADGSAAPILLDESQPSGFEPSYFDHLRFASDGVHLLYDDVLPFESYLYADLLSVPLDGSQAPTQIDTGNLDEYAGNFGYDENSGLDRVAFLEAGVVFSAAFDGTQRVALTPAGWTSDYDRVIVSGSDVLFGAHTATVTSVHRAPLDGSSVGVPLFPGLTTSGDVKQIEVVASTVVFLGQDGFGGLYSVPLAGAPPLLLLNAPVISERGAYSFQIHPDGQRVVFLASPFPASGGLVELFVAPLDDSVTPLKLNGPITGNGDVASFQLSPDGVNVAYRANPTGSSALHGVFGAPLDGLGPVVQHNEPALTDVVGGDVLNYVPARDGKLVVYRADGDLDESFQLFAVDTAGRGDAVPLTALLPDSSDVQPGFALVPAGDRVVFQTAEGALFTLLSAPTTPGAAPVVLDTSTFAYPLPLVVSPDGTRVVYREKTTSSIDHALRSVPIDGSSPPVTLNPALAAGRQVIDFLVSPDGLSVVYRADKARLGEYELFRSPLDGSAPAVRLHGPLVAGRWVWAYQISPDSARVVFRANLWVTAEMDVYSVPIGGGANPYRVNGALTPNGGVFDFTISPDSETVAYRAGTVNPNLTTQIDLFSAPIQRHKLLRRTSGEIRGGVVRLTQLAAGGVDSDFRFSADGTQVLYRANPGAGAERVLYRAPADGSTPPVLLSAPMASNRGVTSFALGPDQSRVVYRADPLTNEVFELFSVPFAGGPAVRLDPLPGFADVSSFRIDAHSERVVYLADRNSDSVQELFAVSIDGSAPAKRLNGPLPVGGSVLADFFPLPGGRTLYRADQVTNDVFELFVSLAHTILPK